MQNTIKIKKLKIRVNFLVTIILALQGEGMLKICAIQLFAHKDTFHTGSTDLRRSG